MIANASSELCTGCSACVNACPVHCIDMTRDKMGFLYPQIDNERCMDCKLCEKICPVIHFPSLKIDDPPKTYAARYIDGEIRIASSSGGLFMLLSRYIILQGGVVFGASFDETFHKVEHIAVESISELCKIQGSKYVQSEMGHSYKVVEEYLKQDKPVLFSGTGCQIAGLKAYLSKDYDNLYLIDVVCHGVPAPEVWDDYLSFLEKKYRGKIKNISFRDKRNGWKNYSLVITFENGKTYSADRVKDPYMYGFLHDIFTRPSCSQCSFKGLERISDITLGDLWGAESIAPDLDDNKGTSLVMVSSEKGKQLFEEIEADLEYRQICIIDVIEKNTAIVKSCNRYLDSMNFEKEFKSKPIIKLLKKYPSNTFLKKLILRVKYKFYSKSL